MAEWTEPHEWTRNEVITASKLNSYRQAILYLKEATDALIPPSKLDALNVPEDGQVPAFDLATGKFLWVTVGVGGDLEAHRTAVPIDHPDGSVTEAKIADSSVTPSKLSAINVPADGKAPLYDAATGRFRWELAGGQLSWMHYRRSGRYHTTPIVGYFIAGSIATNRLIAQAYYNPVTTVYDRIALYVYSAATGKARMGVYASDPTLYPSSLILDAGEVDTGTTGLKEVEINLTLEPGVYWLALLTNSTATFGGSSVYYEFAPLGRGSPYEQAANGWSITYWYGPLPSTFPGGAGFTTTHGYVMLRKA